MAPGVVAAIQEALKAADARPEPRTKKAIEAEKAKARVRAGPPTAAESEPKRHMLGVS